MIRLSLCRCTSPRMSLLCPWDWLPSSGLPRANLPYQYNNSQNQGIRGPSKDGISVPITKDVYTFTNRICISVPYSSLHTCLNICAYNYWQLYTNRFWHHSTTSHTEFEAYIQTTSSEIIPLYLLCPYLLSILCNMNVILLPAFNKPVINSFSVTLLCVLFFPHPLYFSPT